MFCFKIFSAIILANLQISLTCPDGYYWREYTGKIPEDAFIGGKDVNDNNVYVGQAYVHNFGLFPAPIYPGVKEVTLHLGYKPYTVSENIKILCGPQDNFYWEAVNATNLHLLLIGKRAVHGGNAPQGKLNIGRTSLEGELRIGRVHTFEPVSPGLDISHKGKEMGIFLFEILLYDTTKIDARTALTSA